MIKINDTLPEITLEAFYQDKFEKINFADYRGKWLIVLFYPADFTFICPTELEEAAKMDSKFKKEGAQLVSVSTDSAYVHKAWHDESAAIGKVKFPMLADPTGKVSRMFGSYIEDEGVSLRTTLIINPDQKLIAIDMHDNSIGRCIDEIYRKFQAAKFVYDNHGAIVCPASWRPGEKTLKPGIDLVGKI